MDDTDAVVRVLAGLVATRGTTTSISDVDRDLRARGYDRGPDLVRELARRGVVVLDGPHVREV